jgi:GT2 family glycosyltransferase
LDSIQEKTTYKSYEVIVIDNGSKEAETLEYVKGIQTKCSTYSYPGEFNFSAINNFGASQAKGKHLLFLNNDTEVIEPEWLTAMVEQAERPQVGAVGAKLLYPNKQIQHAGVVLGVGGVAGHAFKHFPHASRSYFDFADVIRNCSAVTAACMLVPRKVFDEVKGFNEKLKVAFNDLDLCLRIGQRDYRIIYTPLALLYHHESASRQKLHPLEDEVLTQKLWKDVIEKGDPYYNPNLTLMREDWGLRIDTPSASGVRISA